MELSLRACNVCGIPKPLSPDYFSRDKTAAAGLSRRCKACASAHHKAWRELGGEALREAERQRFKSMRGDAAFAAKQRVLVHDWRKRNPLMVKAQGVRARPVHAANEKHRQSRKTRQTPVWADRAAMKAFYLEAARVTAATGIEHHVDHIVPLKGKLVSGLHVQNNLRVIEGLKNISKGNRLIEELAVA